MDFRTEFFPLLDKALYKKETNVPEHIINSSDVFLMMRYASFYSPHLVEILNELNKKVDSSIEDFGQIYYRTFSSCMPKLKKIYINYISKSKNKNINDYDKFVIKYAQRHNRPEREVWGLIYQLKNLDLI